MSSSASMPAPPGSLVHFDMLEQLIAGSSPHETDFEAFRGLAPTTVVIDVGANIGNSAISAFKVNPALRVVSFEANASLEPYLAKASAYINASGGRHEFHLFGLGQVDGLRTLYVPRIDNWYVIGEGSLEIEHFDEPTVAARLSSYSRHGRWTLESGHVEVRNADAALHALGLIDQPVLVKIDVEGFEDSVVEGLTGFIEAVHPGFMVEISENRRPNRALLERGYEPHVFDVTEQQFQPGFDEDNLNAFYFTLGSAWT